MVLNDLALKIINEVRKLIHEDIIIINTDGIIIASTDSARTGTFHEGSLLAINQGKTFIITTEDEKRLKGVKAGINLPIFFQNEMVGVIGITGNPETISPFGEMLRRMTELLIRENYYTDQIDITQRSLETFVFDWIQLDEWDDSFLERSHMLHIDLTLGRQVIVFEWENKNNIPLDIRQIILDLTNKQNGELSIRWGNNRLLVLIVADKLSNRSQINKIVQGIQSFLQNRLNLPVSVGVGQTMPPKLLSKSYHQAIRSLKVSLKTKTIIFDEDLTIDLILQELSHDVKNTFLNRTIAPILAEQDLLLTIQEFIRQNQSLKMTASSLHIHINTLLYRLNKITELTKLNPRDIHDLCKIYIGISLLDDSTKRHLF
ncbi:sugar diacid recognition domain-containing protein [Bacillus sp. EAC]|uniref:CdaR family transcriptional regulator n=1 Tax=Bacillus sp. EAC TaxID=1978338 RepID=UPI000B44D8DE|nr:sugar diacid recognition domain-containing protein [Bacillus sp. EAC]